MCIIVYNSQTVEITRMAIKKLIVTVLESCCQYACTLNMLHFPTAPPSHLLATRCSSCSSGFVTHKVTLTYLHQQTSLLRSF